MPTAPDDAPDAAGARLGRARRHLRAAHDALHGRTNLPARRRTRAAALFARTALEHVIDAALLTQGHDLGDASTRVRLICLRTRIDAEIGRTAEIAWGGLSSSCHHHAYELSPTWAEVQHLIGLVEHLAQRTTALSTRGV